MRHATIRDSKRFNAELFGIIATIHERGVAHGDLKRKDNILVTPDWYPYLIDFGVSTVRKTGFHLTMAKCWYNRIRSSIAAVFSPISPDPV